MAAASDIPKLEPGNLVKVTVGPNKRRLGTVERATDGKVVVQFQDGGESSFEFPFDKVLHADAIVCTSHEIRQAKYHAREQFPGARVGKVKRLVGGGISPERANFVAQFLRDPTVVEPVEGSLKNSAKHVK